MKVGSEFEASMSKVAAISGATGNDLADLTAKAQEMGARTRYSASEAADAFSYMAMAGWKTGDMLDGIEGIMNLAAASGADLATTSDIVTDALTALGMSAADSGHFADVLAAASSNANTNVELMGETFKYCASMAGSLGYSSEDLALAIGLMANSGLKGSMAGTSLNMVMTRLSTNANGARDAIEELGVSFFTSEGQARPLGTVLGELREKTAGMTAEEKANFANKVAGTQAQKGLLAILNASAEDYEKLAEAVANCTDEETGFSAAAEMAATMMDNLQGDLIILKSATEGFGIALYDAMNAVGDSGSVFRELTQYATDLVNELSEAVTKRGLGGLAEALGSVLAKATTKISEYVPAFVRGATSLLSSFIGGVRSAAPAIANVGMQVGTELIRGIYSIYAQLIQLGAELFISFAESATNNMPELINSVTSGLAEVLSTVTEYAPLVLDAAVQLGIALVSGVVGAIPGLVEAGASAISGLADSIVSNSSLLLDGWAGIYDSVLGVINEYGPIVLEAAGEIISQLVEGVANLIPMIAESASGVFTSIVDTIVALTPVLLDTVVEIGSQIVEALPGVVEGITAVLPGMIDAVATGITTLAPQIVEAGVQLLSSLVTGMPRIIASIAGALPGLISSIAGGILGMLPLIVEAGVQLFTGLVEALPEATYAIVAALPQIISAIVSTLIGLSGEIIAAGVQLLGALAAAAPQAVIAVVAAIPSIIMAIVAAIIDGIPDIIAGGEALLSSMAEAADSAIGAITGVIPTIITAIATAVTSGVGEVIAAGVQLFSSIVDAIPDSVATIIAGIPGMISQIVAGFQGFTGALVDIGTQLIAGIGDGLVAGVSSVLGKAKEVAGSLVSGVKAFFQIASPSKLFKNEIGVMLMRGLALGIDTEKDIALDAAAEAAEEIADTNYDVLADMMRGSVSVTRNVVTKEITEGNTSGSYVAGPADEVENETPEPEDRMLEANFYFDKQKVGRIITPVVAKQLEWDGK